MIPPGLEIGVRETIDLLVVTGLSWLAIRYVRRTRASFAALGLLVLGAIYLTARFFELTLTAAIFQGFFAVLVLVLVVVFQSDLRRIFEQLGAGASGLRRVRANPGNELEILARTAIRLASHRIGALVVLPGREPVDPHIEGGIELGGRVSEPLLLSLFDTHSPGHDGAVVLSGSRVQRFAAHLPLSSDRAQLGPGGTRHAAALGLAECCDALCVVVSEERGTVSVARDGSLRVLARPEDLLAELRAFREPAMVRKPFWRDRATWLEGLAAAGLALGLWALLVPGATRVVVTVPARVAVENLPQAYELESVDPDHVEVTLSGRRRDLLLAPNDMVVRVDALLVELGRRTFELDPNHVKRPAGVEVEGIEPGRVKISVKERGEEKAPPPAG